MFVSENFKFFIRVLEDVIKLRSDDSAVKSNFNYIIDIKSLDSQIKQIEIPRFYRSGDRNSYGEHS